MSILHNNYNRVPKADAPKQKQKIKKDFIAEPKVPLLGVNCLVSLNFNLAQSRASQQCHIAKDVGKLALARIAQASICTYKQIIVLSWPLL